MDGQSVLTEVIRLAGLTSFMTGNANHAQMAGFARDLGRGAAGVPGPVTSAGGWVGLKGKPAFGGGGFVRYVWVHFRQEPNTTRQLTTAP